MQRSGGGSSGGGLGACGMCVHWTHPREAREDLAASDLVPHRVGLLGRPDHMRQAVVAALTDVPARWSDGHERALASARQTPAPSATAMKWTSGTGARRGGVCVCVCICVCVCGVHVTTCDSM